MKTLTLILLLFVFGSINYSCKDKGSNPPSTFEGITETNETGPKPIGKVDDDDWKLINDCPKDKPPVDTTKPVIGPSCTNLFPAYPNPAIKQFTLHFSMATTDSVVIVLNSTKTTTVKEILNTKLLIGSYSVSVNVPDLKPGIYRVYFTVYKTSNILSTYGDVQVQ